jgi:NADH dehydrogenase [ubiquinone] 1 alpha subcomplex assembly factor 7
VAYAVREACAAMTPLEAALHKRIAASGPLSFADYMEACMRDAQYGYYITRDPLGQDGDFTTGPEISQMFGEMIALWCVDTWMKLGEPTAFTLAEGGPGRGTLMDDVLRTVKISQPFMQAAHVRMIEKSPALQAKQAEKLKAYKVDWADSLENLPPQPLIFFANELLDTFAIRRFIRNVEAWDEQTVTVKDDKLAFASKPLEEEYVNTLAHAAYSQAPVGAFAEFSPDTVAFMEKLAAHLKQYGGAALLIDYGYEGPLAADTVQAIRAKKPAPLLEDPGEADITAYVDFGALRRVVEKHGLKAHALRLQRDFLLHCGILHRVKLLKDKATPNQLAKIDLDLERLTSANQMGVLFKVFCITPASFPTPLGF